MAQPLEFVTQTQRSAPQLQQGGSATQPHHPFLDDGPKRSPWVKIVVAISIGLVLLAVVATLPTDSLPFIGGTKQITSDDGAIGLTIPGGWAERADLNPVQTLGAANILEEKYVIVIVDMKASLPPGTTLEEAAQATKNLMFANASNPQVVKTSPPGVAVAGYPAVETVVNAVVSGVDAAYIQTMLDAGDRYVQVIVWTLRTRFDENEAELRSVISSLTVDPSVTGS